MKFLVVLTPPSTYHYHSLPIGKLATTNAENSPVFGPYFDRVFKILDPLIGPCSTRIIKYMLCKNLIPPFHCMRSKSPPQS